MGISAITDRITPPLITHLNEGEIFVFGSVCKV